VPGQVEGQMLDVLGAKATIIKVLNGAHSAYAAAKLNKKVILIEPGFRLGGQSGQKPQEDFLYVYKESFHSFKLYSTKI
jgi:hypothetical protein